MSRCPVSFKDTSVAATVSDTSEMRQGVCAKCGGTAIRAATNGLAIGSSARVGLRPHLEAGYRGAVRVHQTDLWTFACTTCGHLEMYVLDPAALDYIDQNWAPVTASS
jgi:transcription elongation factor Elf1